MYTQGVYMVVYTQGVQVVYAQGVQVVYARVGTDRVYMPGWVLTVCTCPGGRLPTVVYARVGGYPRWYIPGWVMAGFTLLVRFMPGLTWFKPLSDPGYSLGCLRFIPSVYTFLHVSAPFGRFRRPCDGVRDGAGQCQKV